MLYYGAPGHFEIDNEGMMIIKNTPDPGVFFNELKIKY